MLETHMYLDLRGLETKRQFEIYPIVKKTVSLSFEQN